MNDEQRGWLRLPGRVMRDYLVPEAERQLDMDGDTDLAEAVANARVKRQGRGHQAFLCLTPNQIDRLAMWLPEAHRGELYVLADQLRDVAS